MFPRFLIFLDTKKTASRAIVNTTTAAKTGTIIMAKFNLSVGRVMLPATKMKMKTEHWITISVVSGR